jgi:transposase-like protein
VKNALFLRFITFIVYMFQLHKIIDIRACWELLRNLRWSDGVSCPHCASKSVVKNGKDLVQRENQHYACKSCERYFDDLTDTIFSGSQQPLHSWLFAMYLMHLNVSNRQISQELDITEELAQTMCSKIREGVVLKKPVEVLEGIVEVDETYIVAGQKGSKKKSKNEIEKLVHDV